MVNTGALKILLACLSPSVGCRLCTDAHIFVTNVVSTVDYVYYLILRFKTRKKLCDFLTRSDVLAALKHWVIINICVSDWFLIWLSLTAADRWIDAVYAFIPFRCPQQLWNLAFSHSPFSGASEWWWFSLHSHCSFLSSGCSWLRPEGVTVIFKMHHLLTAAGNQWFYLVFVHMKTCLLGFFLRNKLRLWITQYCLILIE